MIFFRLFCHLSDNVIRRSDKREDVKLHLIMMKIIKSSMNWALVKPPIQKPMKLKQIWKVLQLKKLLHFHVIFLCDFSSNWQTGLNIHMGIKHATIEQINGCCEDLDSDTENEEYKSSLHYWKNGLL